MSKTLVAYFSVSGVTRKAAEALACTAGADLYEIVPETPYTAADLDWTNKQSRSTVEMQNLSCRPAIKATVPDVAQYDVVFVGFPIWWGREPSVVDTFLEAADFAGKCGIPFCTSGGSGIEGAAQRIKELTGANIGEGKRLGGEISEQDLKLWTKGLTL